jgi:hypothetical protein
MVVYLLAILALLSFAFPKNAPAARFWPYRITQISSNRINHFNPTINSIGQIGWCQARGNIYESFFTIPKGRVLKEAWWVDAAGGNFKEMVWTQDVNGFSQVFSSVRGQVTSDAADYFEPVVNDQGKIAWVQFVKAHAQIFTNRQGQVTNGRVDHYQPAINDFGEMSESKKPAATTRSFPAAGARSPMPSPTISNPTSTMPGKSSGSRKREAIGRPSPRSMAPLPWSRLITSCCV